MLAYLLIYLCYKDKDRYLNSILVYGKESSLEDGRWEEVTGEKTARNSFIDVAKGIGIILVIIGHAGIPEGVHRVIYSFHMALFFIISGYLFNEKKWVGKLKFIEYTKKRARNYLLPYFVLAIINFVILGTIWGYTQAATVAEYINVLKGYIFGTIYSISGLMPLWAPIWYLTCIFVASIIFFVVMQLRDDLKGIVVACCGVFSWYCYRHLGFRLPWNMSPAGIGVVMMYVGYLIRKYKVLQKLHTWQAVLLIGIGTLCGYYNKPLVAFCDGYYANMILTYMSCITISVGILYICYMYINKNKLIEFYGKSTIIILGFNYLSGTIFNYLYTKVNLPVNSYVYFIRIIFDILVLGMLSYVWKRIKEKN